MGLLQEPLEPLCRPFKILRKKAVVPLRLMDPFKFDNPIELEFRYKRIEAAEAASRGFKGGERIDPYTVRYRLERISEYY